MPKIIILNGPAGSGKDFAANAIQQSMGDDTCLHTKLSWPLKDFAQQIIGLPMNFLEKNKDKQTPHIRVPFRQAQIGIYHQMSTVFGEDWLGKHLVNRLEHIEQPCIVLSDGGREADILPLLRAYDPEDLLLVQIMRENCSFAGDIRTYISLGNVRIKPIVNKGDETFTNEMIDIALEFFGN